jgi:hypothetical protein
LVISLCVQEMNRQQFADIQELQGQVLTLQTAISDRQFSEEQTVESINATFGHKIEDMAVLLDAANARNIEVTAMLQQATDLLSTVRETHEAAYADLTTKVMNS